MIDSISDSAGAAADLKNAQRRRATSDTARADRLPPHSPEAEQGVLGCLLLDPALCLPQCLKRLNGRHAFYDLRHQEIYNACLSLYHQPAGIDLITLQQFLKDAGRLDQVGGIPYLASLPDAVPSAANLSYYLDILAEKHELRRIVQSCTEVVARIYDHAGPLDDLKFSVQSDLADVFGPTHNHADVLAGRKFNPDRQPPEIQPVYLLQDAVISTPGNLDSITSTIKTGKSAVLAAMFGSAMPHPDDTDLLSFSSANPNNLAIVHFDSEQAEDDHWRLIHRTLRRVALDRPPPWFNSYCLTGAGFRETQAAFFQALQLAADSHGGIHSAFLDGLADLVSDVNDAAECNDFVARLMDAARNYHCPIIGVIHFNPGTDKTRGHLGSQFERKAETNLRLDKVDGITTIWSEKQRRAPIPKGKGPSFTWDDESDMHRSCNPAQHSNTKGGRPALVNKIVELNPRDFLLACTKEGENHTKIAERLKEWLASKYVDASFDTCRRAASDLVTLKKLRVSSGLYFVGPNA